MKKQFNSVKTNENQNELVVNANNYSTKNYSADISRPLMFKKTESNNALVVKQNSSKNIVA